MSNEVYAFWLWYSGDGHVIPGRYFYFREKEKALQQHAIYESAGASVTDVAPIGIFSDHLVPWAVEHTE